MKTRTVHLRISEDICKQLSVQASSLGLSLTSYFRLIIHSASVDDRDKKNIQTKKSNDEHPVPPVAKSSN